MDHTPVRSPVCWMGGKAKHAKRIVPLFPEHLTYLEPFGGGGHVLAYKAPSQGEVYNDLDENLVNFMRVCRDQAEELQARLRWVPYSRKQFNLWRHEMRGNRWHELPDVDRAAIWFSILRQCFSASMASGSWGYTTWRHGRAGSWAPDTFANTIEGLLLPFRDRLRHVQIENLSYDDCIQRYEGPEALIYADPPYVGTEQVYAEGGFNEADHRRLAELLHATPAKVVLSYEEHPLVEELYQGWRKVTFQAARHSQKSMKGQKKRVATEVVLLNW